MAVYKASPLGAFTGKLGGMVLTKWKTLLVGRSAPVKVTKKPSEAQEDQRLKLSLVSKFLTVNRKAIDIGFQSASRKMTPLNYATRYHMGRVIYGIYPDYKLNYSEIKLTLPNSVNQIANGKIVNVNLLAAGKLEIRWKAVEFPNDCTMNDDCVCLLIYNEAKQKSLFIQRVAQRDELSATIVLPDAYWNINVHAYLFFLSANGKLVSATHYLGSFIC